MTVPTSFTHPRAGIRFHWWAVDPAGRVGLFSSAFGPVPAVARTQAAIMDDATEDARSRHPEWFDREHCDDHDCPRTHCPAPVEHGPYLFTWDDDHDDRYIRYGTPTTPLHIDGLPARTATAARLVEVTFPFAQADRINLNRHEDREILSGSAETAAGRPAL